VKIPAQQLPAQLERNLAPCYFVAGDEPLLVIEALDAIRKKARSSGYLSRDLFVVEQGFDWSEFAAAGGNLSLFSEKRIIELRLPTGKPGRAGAARIIEMTEQLGDDLLLLVSAPKLDQAAQKSKWVAALASAGAHVQVWPVAARELPSWVDGRMRIAGLQPDRDAVRVIVDRVEGNLLAAQQEIEKLKLLYGEGPVTAEQVDGAVADSSRFDVFTLVDTAVGGDARRALRILRGVREEGVDAVIVVWALTRELRLLTMLSEKVRDGADLGREMQQARVWKSRQGIVRACIGRLDTRCCYDLLHVVRRADSAAKGQSSEDAWQLLGQIVLVLARGMVRAA
jgi:DNA polymerase-3 subunit delta